MHRLAAALLTALAWAGPFQVPAFGADAAPVQPAALKAWQDMRFGLFIHWGPVSLTGREIGLSRGAATPVADYDRLYLQFNPTNFDARAWASVAKAAGMKYVVLTTKHHDGFCLWDTKQTDYNIMKSPFGRDVVKELAAACRAEGLAFGTYYSVCDWHHPDFPRTSPGGRVRREKHDLEAYTAYLERQVTELVRNYGPLILMWFDVPQEFDRARGVRLINLVRGLQPSIIVNNRSGAPGDYDTPEQKIGGFNLDRPWETCMTICRQWAWKPDDAMKSLKECLQTLVLTAGGNGNLLFNVGPMPDGRIEERQVERLREMGAWLAKYGESIYGTRGGPFRPDGGLASTRRDDVIYLHVLRAGVAPVTLPLLARKILRAEMLTGGGVDLRQTDEAVTLTLAPDAVNEIDAIVKLTLDGSAMDLPAPGAPAKAAAEVRPADGRRVRASNVFREDAAYGPARALDGDARTRWATDAGVRQAWLEIEYPAPVKVSSVTLAEAFDRVRAFELQYRDGAEWRTILRGTAIGKDFTKAFEPVTASVFRLHITDATDGPTLWEIGLE